MKDLEVLCIDNNCEQRIKPQFIRDMKTEALLVFCRTALESFFEKLNKENLQITLLDEEDTKYVYDTLNHLLDDLKKHIVNGKYLVEVVQSATQNPQQTQIIKLLHHEEPLIVYYDAMVKRLNQNIPSNTPTIPELVIICVLCNWFVEDERSTILFPFINKYDLFELIAKFESYGLHSNDETKRLISKMQFVAIDVVEALKKSKYKLKTNHVSKQRKKKLKRKRNG